MANWGHSRVATTNIQGDDYGDTFGEEWAPTGITDTEDGWIPIEVCERIWIRSKSGRQYSAYVKSLSRTTSYGTKLDGVEIHIVIHGGLQTRLISWEKVAICVRRSPTGIITAEEEEDWVPLFESDAEDLNINAPIRNEHTAVERGYPNSKEFRDWDPQREFPEHVPPEPLPLFLFPENVPPEQP